VVEGVEEEQEQGAGRDVRGGKRGEEEGGRDGAVLASERPGTIMQDASARAVADPRA